MTFDKRAFWQDLLTALPAFGVFASVGVNALDSNN